MVGSNAVTETIIDASTSTWTFTPMKTYLYRSNRLPMQTLDWKSPIVIRKALLGTSS